MWDALTATVAVSMPWITSGGVAEVGRLHEDLGQHRDDLLKNPSSIRKLHGRECPGLGCFGHVLKPKCNAVEPAY
jgi:hypothetical protein